MFNPTNEQIAINNVVKLCKDVYIEALAGTGKSTTLRYLAEQNKDKNFACLCFNAANAEEANLNKDKPDNIIYLTVHGLAYREIIGKRKGYKNKLGNYLDFNDLDTVRLKSIIGYEAYKADEEKARLNIYKKGVLETINMFCKTDKDDLRSYAKSILTFMFSAESESTLYKQIELDSERIEKLARFVKEHWLHITDSTTLGKITHDVYLKMYELEQIKMFSVYDKDKKTNVELDVIMIDEFQDSNQVTLSIFLNQTRLQKIAVGDANQTIYSWRGALGKVENLDGFEYKTLTESFRFGADIARKANKILEKQTDLRLVGLGGLSGKNTSAHLCRTNTSVLSATIEYIKQGKKVYTNINLKDVFSKLWHIEQARWNKEIRYPHKELLNITNKESLDEMLSMNEEIKSLIRLIEFFNNRFGGLVKAKNELINNILPSPAGANITVSTIHRSKGLEWDNVVIDDDFIVSKEDEVIAPLDKLGEDSELRNLLYVAVTRSKGNLTYPSYLDTLLR